MSLLRRLRGNSSIGQMQHVITPGCNLVFVALHHCCDYVVEVFLRADLVPVRMVGV